MDRIIAMANAHWTTRAALFLDIDGTLLDIADHPDAVFVPDSLPELLDRLKLQCGGALALVSGRSLASIDRLFGKNRFDCAASHGALLRIAGVVRENPHESREILAAIQPAISAVSLRFGALFVEDKGHAAAVHYRSVPAAEGILFRMISAVVEPNADRWRIIHGKAVIEVAPRSTTKATAVLEFLREAPFRARWPVFAGDDVTDEDAFAEVARRGGLGIFIADAKSSRRSLATRRLQSPEHLRRWLAYVWSQGNGHMCSAAA